MAYGQRQPHRLGAVAMKRTIGPDVLDDYRRDYLGSPECDAVAGCPTGDSVTDDA